MLYDAEFFFSAASDAYLIVIKCLKAAWRSFANDVKRVIFRIEWMRPIFFLVSFFFFAR